MIRKREDEVEKRSKITDRGEEMHIMESEVKGVRVNLGKLGSIAKPDVLV